MKGKKLLYKLVNPGLDEYSVHLNEAVFHNANGYIGIRYDFEEDYPQKVNVTRSQYINGVYDYVDMPQAEKLYGLADEKQCMLSVANTQGINLKLDGEYFRCIREKSITGLLQSIWREELLSVMSGGHHQRAKVYC